jgi:hypothetical protein
LALGVQLQTDEQAEPKYDYGRADWGGFRQALQEAVYPADGLDIDTWYAEFRQVILTAAEGTVPKKVHNLKFKHPANPWWNSECKQHQREQRKAYARYKKCQNEETYNDLKQTRIAFKKTVAEAKLNYWVNYTEENIGDYKDVGKMWKKVTKLKRRYNAPERPLVYIGKKTVNLKEKADVLADTFASASRTESLPAQLRAVRQEREKHFSDPVPDNDNPINFDFSMQDLENAIQSITDPKKATGSDQISYRMIKQFPEVTKRELLRFFCHCWQSGTMPAAWKQATVLALPKQGKPPSNPASYRPISLTPHLGKLYERLIKVRLEFYLEKNKIIPVFQAGFRKKQKLYRSHSEISIPC